MKKLSFIALLLSFVLFACKDDCKDVNCLNGGGCSEGTCICPTGYSGTNCEVADACLSVTCENNGVCENGICNCAAGYEGVDCSTASNEKFVGTYNITYTGTGSFASTNSSSTAIVDTTSHPDEIRISTVLDLQADALGTLLNLPVTVDVVARVNENTYSVPNTTISTSVDPGIGIAIPIDIVFYVDGTLSGDTLYSDLVVSGTMTGEVNMVGVK